jgi:hypothetical protein
MALLKDDFLLNLMKQSPLDFPSSLKRSFRLMIYPQASNTPLMSSSKAWKERPLTQISNSPSSSTSYSTTFFLESGF